MRECPVWTSCLMCAMTQSTKKMAGGERECVVRVRTSAARARGRGLEHFESTFQKKSGKETSAEKKARSSIGRNADHLSEARLAASSRAARSSSLRRDSEVRFQSEDGLRFQSEEGVRLQSEEGSRFQSEDGVRLQSDEGSRFQSEEGVRLQSEDGSRFQSDDRASTSS